MPPDKGKSYAQWTKPIQNDYEDKNILIIKVKKTNAAKDRQFDDEICEQLCKLLGIRPVIDTLGCQYIHERNGVTVDILLKDEIQAARFSTDVWREICPGFDLLLCHPASSKEVSLLVLDLSP